MAVYNLKYLMLIPPVLLLLGVIIWMMVEFNKIKFDAVNEQKKGIMWGMFSVQLALAVIITCIFTWLLFSQNEYTYKVPLSMLVVLLLLFTIIQMTMSFYFGEMKVADTSLYSGSYENVRLYLYFGTIAYIVATISIVFGWYMYASESDTDKRARFAREDQDAKEKYRDAMDAQRLRDLAKEKRREADEAEAKAGVRGGGVILQPPRDGGLNAYRNPEIGDRKPLANNNPFVDQNLAPAAAMPIDRFRDLIAKPERL